MHEKIVPVLLFQKLYSFYLIRSFLPEFLMIFVETPLLTPLKTWNLVKKMKIKISA